MDFDETKKIEVEISENNFVENRVGEKKKSRFGKRRLSESGLDGLDMAIIPVAIGVFLSLGFLFANLIKATAAQNVANDIITAIASIF
jgi:hypothetical protein